MTDPQRLTRSIVNMEPLSLSSEFGFTRVLEDVKAVVVLVICEALTNMLIVFRGHQAVKLPISNCPLRNQFYTVDSSYDCGSDNVKSFSK